MILPNSSQISFSPTDFDSYRVKLGSIFLLSIFTNSFGAYIVLRHSPREMRTYRWFLLNIIFWAFIVDVFLSLLFQPYPLLPIYGICSLGLAGLSQNNFWGVYLVGIVFLEVSATCCGSIFLALYYRIAILMGTDSKFVRWATSTCGLIFFCLLTCFFYVAVAAICLATIIEIEKQQTELRQEHYTNYTGLREMMDNNYLCIFSRMTSQLQVIFSCAVVFIVICTFFYILFVSISVFSLFYKRRWLSANTFRMHRNFIFSLLLQIAVPFSSVFVPISVPIFCVHFDQPYPRALDDVLVIVCSFHSTLNVLVMITSCRPYFEASRHILLIMPLSLCFNRFKNGDKRRNTVEVVQMTRTQTQRNFRSGERFIDKD